MECIVQVFPGEQYPFVMFRTTLLCSFFWGAGCLLSFLFPNRRVSFADAVDGAGNGVRIGGRSGREKHRGESNGSSRFLRQKQSRAREFQQGQARHVCHFLQRHFENHAGSEASIVLLEVFQKGGKK